MPTLKLHGRTALLAICGVRSPRWLGCCHHQRWCMARVSHAWINSFRSLKLRHFRLYKTQIGTRRMYVSQGPYLPLAPGVFGDNTPVCRSNPECEHQAPERILFMQPATMETTNIFFYYGASIHLRLRQRAFACVCAYVTCSSSLLPFRTQPAATSKAISQSSNLFSLCCYKA